jgi:transcription elongation GreA/GreB family factor
MKTKEQIIQSLIRHFESELSALIQSAKAAHSAATHEESRAEDRHDTFAIEASYLAAGQATRVEELQKTLKEFEGYLSSCAPLSKITLGAFVTYLSDDQPFYVFVSQHGGGTKIQIESETLQVLSLQSPLGESLEGAKAGEEIEFELRGSVKEYRIKEVS